jgi:hypothetical protein
MQKLKLILVEDLEELLPGSLLQLLVILAEVEAQDAAASAAGAHDGGASAALFRPTADLVVIGCRRCLTHDSTSRKTWRRRHNVQESQDVPHFFSREGAEAAFAR